MSLEGRFRICNAKGLHARAAAMFVDTAARFTAEITVIHGDRTASGKSIMALMILAAANGTEIDVVVEGPDAEDALAAIGELIAARFHEDD